MTKENPFPQYKYLKPKYFCGRRDETAQISHLIKENENISIIGRPGVGKTSLIRHLFYKLSKTKTPYCFYFDVIKLANTNFLLRHIYKKICSFESNRGLNEESKEKINNENNICGLIAIEMIMERIQLLDKHLVIAIDNIHLIESTELSFKLIESFKLSENISLIILGTKKVKNFDGFREVELFEIARKGYIKFISAKFSDSGRKISAKAITKIFKLTRGETSSTQLICSKLWQTNQVKVNNALVDSIVEQILIESKNYYSSYRNMLSFYQWKLLSSIAEEKEAEQVTSAGYIDKFELNAPSSVNTALKALMEKGLIYKENTSYFITNPILGLWLGNLNKNL